MRYKCYFFPIVTIGLSVFSTLGHALPFNITPQGVLPTTVITGRTVTASYTISNNTTVTRKNNFVKWLPPNVTQVLDPSDTTLCGSTFALASGQSCTLQLSISGSVDRNDPNPQHHLFVCFPGGRTCAGPTPENSLNVEQQAPPVVNPILSLVGGYVNGSSEIFPLTYVTTDNGQTWPTASLPSVAGLPLGALGAFLRGVACSGANCATVGLYGNSLNQGRPVTYTSADAGLTWSEAYLPSITGISSSSRSVSPVAVSCVGANCASVGYYELLGNDPLPFAYSSANRGASWSDPILLSTTGIPVGNLGSRLSSISCSGSNCTAVGFYIASNSNRAPLAYVSTNNGVTWSNPVFPSDAGLPVGNAGAFLSGVSCVGLNCVAVGSYTDALSRQHPISYSSANGGASWSAVNILSESGLPANQGGRLNGVSCADTTCTAVGYYTELVGSATQSTSYISTDSGVTWSNPIVLPTSSIPAGFLGAGLFGVSCATSGACSAIGVYVDASSQTQPLTYYSANNGLTWTIYLPSIATIPTATLAVVYGVGGAESGSIQV